MYGFFRIAAAVPRLNVADPAFNCAEILRCARQAAEEKSAVVVLPELAVTTAGCGRLFHSSALLDAAERGLLRLIGELPAGPLFFIGAPVRWRRRLFSASVAVRNGTVLGIVPRQSADRGDVFAPGAGITGETTAFGAQEAVPFGTDLLFSLAPELQVAVVFGEDLLSPFSPDGALAAAGATLIISPSASFEIIGRAECRRELFRFRSRIDRAGFCGVSGGVGESTTDTVCGGHALAAECGKLILDAPRFCREGRVSTADFDFDRIGASRLEAAVLPPAEEPKVRIVSCGAPADPGDLRRKFSRTPFLPPDAKELAERCEEVLQIQSAGLARRMEHTRTKGLVLGISGGLDSTLALVSCVRTLTLLGRPASELTAVTMPGFGTTDRTYQNAVTLCRTLGVDLREISIREACVTHFAGIGHDPAERNVVYENAQARERTQILLDLANKLGKLAIGTGDLSEGALGWCTFNGDHISMYALNGSVPKTMIPALLRHAADTLPAAAREVLEDVIATPVSPELLPADAKGGIQQKTELLIGPYEVHDFFLYHFCKYGASPEKLLFLASRAFDGVHSPEALKGYLKIFLRRFVTQQFKRNCSPDGPKVGSISLSPRSGDWEMPSDASPEPWLPEGDAPVK